MTQIREYSMKEKLALLPPEEVAKMFSSYSEEEIESMINSWNFIGRPKQLLCLEMTDWDTFLILSGRGFGKSLSLEESILTVNKGWIKFGKLEVGDKVFDEQGNSCNVTKLFNVETPKKCYRLNFSDNSSIKCCSEHLFSTFTFQNRSYYKKINSKKQSLPDNWVNFPLSKNPKKKLGTIKSTEEIVSTIRVNKRQDLNHSIPTCKPLNYRKKNLPIDPYYLGLYVGDGLSDCGQIVGHTSDIPKVQEVLEKRFPPNTVFSRKRNNRDIAFIRVEGMYKLLKENNLLFNKHIPEIYLKGSIKQRLDFLCGAMDSDGTISKNGDWCNFSQVSYTIAKQIHSLVISLGMKARIFYRDRDITKAKHQYVDGYKRKSCQRLYNVEFSPTLPCFKLPRKLERFYKSKNFKRRSQRMITSYEEIIPEPMRCIQVDSPNNMFLIGESLIATHNSRTAAEWMIEQARLNPGTTMAIIAPTKEGYRKYCIEGDAGILNNAPKGFADYKSSLARIDFANGTTCNLYTAEEPERLRGANLSKVWWDEICACPHAVDTYDMLSFAHRLGNHPQLLITSTPKPHPILSDIILKEEELKNGQTVIINNYDEAKELKTSPSTIVVTGNSFENTSNLPERFFKKLRSRYENTELGRQEIYGEILQINDGKIFKKHWFDQTGYCNEYIRTVIAVDPATTKNTRSNSTGIVVASEGFDGMYYIRHVEQVKDTPQAWAKKCLSLYDSYDADSLVIEGNQGGDLVRDALSNVNSYIDDQNKLHIVNFDLINFKLIFATKKNSESKTGNKGKVGRAENISILYEKGKVFHTQKFADLEQQFLFLGDPSLKEDDLADAAVYALTEIAQKDLVEVREVYMAMGKHGELKNNNFLPTSKSQFMNNSGKSNFI